ncbi:MAG: DUF1643 domain-containing protein [Verrucomicrobia bacterium]|nr:DUF1643 domain-containing protein [Verrucomicrobiota bacterium]MBV8279138.1 DUF1643 domain-containing protein [Verrucomicrobiota bacterium]
MNQCIFSPDRIYRYVLRCRCADSASENSPSPISVGYNSERAHYSNTQALRKPACQYSRTRTTTRTRTITKRIAWIGLNPSRADEDTLDQTMAAVCRYSRKWGFTEVVMLNLFAFRATDPRNMKQAADPIGPDNDRHLLTEVSNVDRVMACWGDHGKFLGRDRQVSDLLGVSFQCLLRNRTGAPHHPLYLKPRIRPQPFGLD